MVCRWKEVEVYADGEDIRIHFQISLFSGLFDRIDRSYARDFKNCKAMADSAGWLGSYGRQGYNANVSQTIRSRYLPDPDRLSVLAATLLLAYTVTHFVVLPTRELEYQLPGIFLSVQLNANTLVSLIAAGLTASGADWLLRDHPALQGRSTIQHWLLPALTAWVIGIPLLQLPLGLVWWGVFGVGGVLLLLILVAEYIVVDPEDLRYFLASAALTAFSFALFLMLAIVLRSAGLRLFLVLPAVFLAAGLVSLRTLHLRSQGQWKFVEALVIALIVSQMAAALHYWHLPPISFGLAVLGPAYALTSLLNSLSDGESFWQALFEPGLVLLVVWGTALWMI